MRILIAASDPGGGNAVFPVVKLLRRQGHEVDCIIEAKSRDIFLREKIAFREAKKFTPKKIHGLFKKHNDVFLFGVSGGRDKIEKKILHFAHKNKVPSIAIMDFWSNYWERFLHHKKKNAYFLPDYICVIDTRMKKEMIREGFPQKKILVTGNPYFDIFLSGITKRREDKKHILFISQPFRHDFHQGSKNYGYTEYGVLEDLLYVLKKLNLMYRLFIRLHPREPMGKFNDILKKKIFPAEYDGKKNLEQSLSRAGVIVGMNSMVLLQAALAGKKVISFQPHVTEDVLPSNRMKLSVLAHDRRDLEKWLKKYYDTRNEKAQRPRNVFVPHATENVISVLKKISSSP